MKQYICDICGSEYGALDRKTRPDNLYRVVVTKFTQKVEYYGPNKQPYKCSTGKQIGTRDICSVCAERILNIKAEDK